MKKKLMTLFVAIVAVFGFGILVSNAVTPTTITITGASDKHSYKAYQVFSGKLSRATEETDSSVVIPDQMVDIEWGSGVDGTEILRLVNAKLEDDYKKAHEGSADGFKKLTTAQAVADYLDKRVNAGREDDDEVAQWFAGIVGQCLIDSKATGSVYKTNVHEIKLPDEGYYFIKDVTLDLNTPEDESYTRYLLKVFGVDTTIEVKADEATLTKKVVDGANGDQAQTTAQITDTVTFHLYAKLPRTYADYDTYKLVFHDQLSTGLTYVSYKAYVVNGSEKSEITSSVTKSEGTGTEILFTITDLNSIQNVTLNKDSIILVEYTTTVNANAVTGKNINSAKLEFSNEPNEKAATNPKLGTTATSTATVYTYALDITKEDGRNSATKLADVKFILCENNTSSARCAKFTMDTDTTTYVFAGWVAKDQATPLVTNSSGKIAVRGFAATTYYLVETETVTGYNLLREPEEVTIAYSDTNYTKELTVKNYKGSFLPSTGGIGTVIFYVCGVALMGGAIYFVIANKKKSEEK